MTHTCILSVSMSLGDKTKMRGKQVPQCCAIPHKPWGSVSKSRPSALSLAVSNLRVESVMCVRAGTMYKTMGYGEVTTVQSGGSTRPRGQGDWLSVTDERGSKQLVTAQLKGTSTINKHQRESWLCKMPDHILVRGTECFNVNQGKNPNHDWGQGTKYVSKPDPRSCHHRSSAIYSTEHSVPYASFSALTHSLL